MEECGLAVVLGLAVTVALQRFAPAAAVTAAWPLLAGALAFALRAQWTRWWAKLGVSLIAVIGLGYVLEVGHAMAEGGMMRMREIGPQRLTDDGPLVFTPGGRHLMVHGLDPVSEGDTVEGWLVFERAGRVPVTFQVRAVPPGSPPDAG